MTSPSFRRPSRREALPSRSSESGPVDPFGVQVVATGDYYSLSAIARLRNILSRKVRLELRVLRDFPQVEQISSQEDLLENI